MKRLLAFLTIFGSFFATADKWQEISAAQLLSDSKEDRIIIDVRSPEEFAEGHVPGAINIAHTAIADNIEDLLQYKDTKQVVLYCRSGYRAGKAASELKDNGFDNLYHLSGDMLGWQNEGHPIEKN